MRDLLCGLRVQSLALKSSIKKCGDTQPLQKLNVVLTLHNPHARYG